MPIEINVDSEQGIVLVKTTDLVGVVDLSEAIESVLLIMQKQKLNKILVDATALILLPTTMHLNWFASELSKHTKDLKHAIIISQQTSVGVSEIKKFAQNLGVNMQLFFSKDDAVSWLNQYGSIQ